MIKQVVNIVQQVNSKVAMHKVRAVVAVSVDTKMKLEKHLTNYVYRVDIKTKWLSHLANHAQVENIILGKDHPTLTVTHVPTEEQAMQVPQRARTLATPRVAVASQRRRASVLVR